MRTLRTTTPAAASSAAISNSDTTSTPSTRSLPPLLRVDVGGERRWARAAVGLA